MFSINDLRGMSRPDQLAAAAKYAGVEPKVMEGIWRTESSYGKAMLSPAGAQGHFGLMPKTRATWEQRLGVPIDPNDFTESLLVSAYQMKENMTATKRDVGDALRMYNSGTNRSKWGNAETTAYPGKVLGIEFGAKAQEYAAAPMETPGTGFGDMGFEEAWFGRKPAVKEGRADVVKGPKAEAMVPARVRKVDLGYDASNASMMRAKAEQDGAVAFAKDQSFGDMLAAGFRAGSITDAGIQAFERLHKEAEPGFDQWKGNNLNTIYKEAQSEGELHMLLGSSSRNEYNTVIQQLKEDRMAVAVLNSDGAAKATMFGLAGQIIDPANIALGLLTDGAFTAAKISGSMALRSGQIAKGLALYSAEGAIGGIAGTALLDAAGDRQGLNDYLMNGTAGLALGAVGGSLGIRKARDNSLMDYAVQAREHAVNSEIDLMKRAAAEAGEGADVEAIKRAAAAIEERQITETVRAATSPVPAHERLMPMRAEDVMTGDPELLARMQKEGQTDLVSAEGQARLNAELYANAERINLANPTDPRGLTNVSGWLPGGESTAMTLLKESNPVAQAYAKIALESTTGAAGRRQVTAALSKHIYERQLKQDMFMWGDTYDGFRKQQGRGLLSEAANPTALKDFNRRVFFEIEARGKGISDEKNAFVLKGADMYEAAMERALKLQKSSQTVGHARLPDTAKGYVTHRLSVEKVVGLNADQKRAVIGTLSQQFQDLNQFRGTVKEGAGAGEKAMMNFDKEFSDRLATQYLERATHRQHGQFEIPINLNEPAAADLLEDALKAMDMDKFQRAELQGSLARGGAGYTKGRLKLDMAAEIPDGNGGTMLLGDLFDQDINALFHSYSARVSGEAALAQHGIMGQKGLKAIIQAAIDHPAGLSQKAREAMEQTANEFMNMRVGDKRHAWLDNVSVATSAARLGMAVVNQLGDYSNAVSALGVKRAVGSIGTMPRMLKEVGQLAKDGKAANPILRDFDHMGYVGLDDYQSSRLFDVRDYDVEISGRNDVGTFGRIIRMGANAQYIMTGHRRLVAAQTRGMSEQILTKAMHYIKHGKEDIALTDMGLGNSLRERLRSNMDKIAKFNAKGQLESLDMHAGDLTPQDLLSIRQVIDRGAGQIVQKTYIGETGAWVHDSMLSALYKFRTFSITAMEKQWSRNTMNRGHLIAFATLMGSMSWAIPIHAARVHAKTIGMSRSEAEKYKEKNLNWLSLGRASMNYSAMSGLMGDIIDVGAGYAGSFGGEGGKAFATQMGQSGRQGQTPSIMGMIPATGMVEDAWKATHGDMRSAMKVLPGSNALGLQQLVNWATQDKDGK
jgi:hypothetical protein